MRAFRLWYTVIIYHKYGVLPKTVNGCIIFTLSGLTRYIEWGGVVYKRRMGVVGALVRWLCANRLSLRWVITGNESSSRSLIGYYNSTFIKIKKFLNVRKRKIFILENCNYLTDLRETYRGYLLSCFTIFGDFSGASMIIITIRISDKILTKNR